MMGGTAGSLLLFHGAVFDPLQLQFDFADNDQTALLFNLIYHLK
jgi:hypothetical protein